MFTLDFLDDGTVLEWSVSGDGATVAERSDYCPRFFVGPRTPETAVDTERVRDIYESHPNVVRVETVRRRPGWRRDPEPVLAVDVDHVDRVPHVAQQSRQLSAAPVGDVACYNVDLSRGFRYCLETETDPAPAAALSTLRLSVPLPETGGDQFDQMTVGGTTVTGGPAAVVEAVRTALTTEDPDVLVVSTAEIIPTIAEMAADAGRPGMAWGRREDIPYRTLAGASTVTSYGRVGHSPARYSIPGRAIIDESNTFFFREAGLDGMLDLVGRSRKPVQELAWASVGNVLTAIQVCEARERGVLAPWRSWRHELFKPMGTLHDADRGGFIFAPEVGVHDDVHELDFASLYPNIICQYNISPDTIRCDCHRDRADVPELGYAVCDDRGYLADVLQPIIDDRAAIKRAIGEEQAQDSPDTERLKALSSRSSALKWVLVSCFGYQGFNNAKFGRIECHEAINAIARDILLQAKSRLEAGGWRVVHGIVDSVWVTASPDEHEQEPLDEVAADISETVGIRLEHEGAFDWVAFVPRRESDAGALTKYFGRPVDGDGFKIRGIEARQRSTPPYVASVQRDCLRVFDETRSPDAVVQRLAAAVSRLHDGAVPVAELVERKQVSKRVDAYRHSTRTVAALRRAADRDLAIHPGQDVEYVVVDDERETRDRVALAHEGTDDYDADYYETELVRAVESILSPLDIDREDVRERLQDTVETSLAAFSDGGA